MSAKVIKRLHAVLSLLGKEWRWSLFAVPNILRIRLPLPSLLWRAWHMCWRMLPSLTYVVVNRQCWRVASGIGVAIIVARAELR